MGQGAVSVLALAVAASVEAAIVLLPADVARIDVIVADARGRAIENLKAADFELREDGTLQSIDEVRFVKVDAGARGEPPPAVIRSEVDEQAEAVRDNTRLFAVFLDDYHASGGANTQRVRD